ncbi:MAG: hypothetical protein J5958_06440 [Clostridia bacterium]|nr:hypothetical protein [Clostridia bacterium]
MTNNQPNNNEEQKSSSRGCFSFILAIAIIAGIVFGMLKMVDLYSNTDSKGDVVNKDGNPLLLERSARLTDISVNQNTEATLWNLQDTYTVIPNTDIKNLQITFEFFDDDGNKVKQITKDVGSVVKGSQYDILISHSLSDLSTISQYSYKVTGGTVSYSSK